MSRTYRFRKGKDQYLIDDQRVLTDFTYIERENRFGYSWREYCRVKIDPDSVEGNKLLSKFHSDRKHHVMIWKGPSWFNRLFSQKPYRTRSKEEIHKFLRNPEHEVIIENKPPREYWW